jgi:diacylglycerol kinase family enzyme
LLQEEIKRGATTAVIVGNNQTLGSIISKCADLPLTFGFLPIGPDNTSAEVLGIPVSSEAALVLARRRREYIDTGIINQRYFISQVHVLPSKVQISSDTNTPLISNEGELLEIVVCNLQPPAIGKRKEAPAMKVDPQDGKLEAYIQPLTKKRWWGYNFGEPQVFSFTHMRIMGQEPFEITVDGKVTKEIDISISMAPSKIDMIVGRKRQF